MDNFIIEMTVDTNYPLMRIEDFNPRLLELTNKKKYKKVEDEEIKKLEIKKTNKKLEKDENIDIRNVFSNEKLATSFLLKKKMFGNNIDSKCPKCGSNVKYYLRFEGEELRKMLQCTKDGCQTTLNLRKNNYFFTHTNKIGRSPNALSNRDQLELIYYWCKETPLTTISHITGRHLCTVKRWVNKCQEIPLQKFKKRRKLGGFGKNIYIHCYSFKHLQVKDHLITNCDKVGHFNLLKDRDGMQNSLPKKGSWFFVLCENNEKRYFFIKNVEKRLLSSIFKQEINNNTMVHLHKFNTNTKSYMISYIPNICNDVHYNISDENSYADNVASLWLPVIYFYKKHKTVFSEQISRYLIEMWWRSINKSDPFNAFLRDLSETC